MQNCTHYYYYYYYYYYYSIKFSAIQTASSTVYHLVPIYPLAVGFYCHGNSNARGQDAPQPPHCQQSANKGVDFVLPSIKISRLPVFSKLNEILYVDTDMKVIYPSSN